MKTRHTTFSFIFALFALVSQAGGVLSWRAAVDGLMEQGQFAQAEQVMKSLPGKVRRQQAVAIDSLLQVMGRIRKDFTMTPEEGKKLILEKYPQATDAQIENWKHTKALEVMNIDGQEWWFRKSVRNLWLLGKEFALKNKSLNDVSAATRLKYFREAMKCAPDVNGVRDWRHVNITFTLDIDPDVIPAGETYRMWMPFPFENLRQRNIKLESSNLPVTHSMGSKHHTVYAEAKAVKGQPTHFEYTFSYDVAERHISQQDLLALVEPYKHDAFYKKYTSSELPHIVITGEMQSLAGSIVGEEENPVLAASLIYHWIAQRFPWAGAREYSTLSNIPEYVLAHGHGDCGQVSLLYITLCRAAGIPARWESGYMLHPGEENYHDWGEIYFEGVGWVPTDMSFGRSTEGTALHDYYATGIDLYRLATNEGIGDQLSPAKKYIRSETVDFQPGEVEWKNGNIYYDHWDSTMRVNEITPLEDNRK